MSKKQLQDKIGLASIGLLALFTVGTTFFSKETARISIQEPDLEGISNHQDETNPQEELQESEGEQTTQLSENDQLTVDLVNELTERLENQGKVDAMIQSEVESGYYTIENPLVILDPYTQSPLTALICFTTEQPTRVRIHVEGEDEYTEVNHSFSELTTQHVVPIYGLYPDKLNPVTIWVYDEKGELVGEKMCEIQTEPVSDHFQDLIILTETFQEGYCEGINFLWHNKLAFDKQGKTRWYFSKNDYHYVTDYNFVNSKFLMALRGGNDNSTALFLETDKLGRMYNIYHSPYGLHHDMTITCLDTFLGLGHNTIGDTVQDFIYELDLETGNILDTIDLKYILQRSRLAWDAGDTQGKAGLQDWLHMNSIEYDESDNTIVISSNFQSAVVKMDWPSGEIHWIMGNHDDWNPRMQQYLLTPTGDPFEWHYNQHSAEILSDYDDDPDTIDILLFDNGSTRFYQDPELQRQIRNNEIVSPNLYSRLVHYRINEVTMEIQQIGQYGKERELTFFSRWESNVHLLNNNNVLGMSKHQFDNVAHPVVVEITEQNNLIWEAEIFSNNSNGHSSQYRAERLPFYFDDDAEHDIYTTARNLIPDDIMEFVQNYNENPPIIQTEGENTDETQTEDTN